MNRHPSGNVRCWVHFPFNMVEIVLALGVIAVGVISILALFPIGLSASRDAMADSCGAETADQMLHQLEYLIRQPGGWDAYIFDLDSSGNTPWIPTSIDSPNLATVSPEPSFSTTAEPNSNDTLYKAVSPPSCVNKGVYKIIRYSDANGNNTLDSGELIDFQAIIKVYRSQVVIPPTPPPGLPYSTVAQLTLEISWPAQLPYAQRQKGYYTKELFNRL